MVMNNSAGTQGDASVPRLLQPVDNIDAAVNIKVSSPEIKISADDASRYNGSNNIADPTLVMGYIKNPSTTGTVVRSLGVPNAYSNDNSTYYVRSDVTCSVKMDATTECPAGQITQLNSGSGSSGQDGLLLFRNLNIPKGVTITSATLELRSSGSEPWRNPMRSPFDSLGWVAFRQGQYAEALKILQTAYKARPDAEIAAHLGEVLWVMGQRQEAGAIWREGLLLKADNDTLVETLKRFEFKP